MDLDLAQVRAFVATADELHFGRAAERLHLSQQALSKRVARLEEVLGVRLFDRSGHSVVLTAPGERFLEPARQVLAAGDRAVLAAREDGRPLRLDVWGQLFYPMRSIRQLVEADPDLTMVVGIRSLATLVSGFQRDEVDVAFGRLPLGEPLPEGLTARLVRLDPVGVALSARHPLAGASKLTPGELRGTRLWFPAPFAALDFMRGFMEKFGLSGDFGDANLGMEYFAEQLRDDLERVSLLPCDVPLPRDQGVRIVPLVDPTPLYSWSLVWRKDEQHPLLEPLLATFTNVGRLLGWLTYDPAVHWLPEREVRPDPEKAQPKEAAG